VRRALALALIALGLILALASVAQADTTTIPASNDTFVRSDQPTASFGTATLLHVDGQVVGDPTEPERQSYLRFSGAPSNATSAKLRLHIPYPTTQGYQVRALSCSAWTDAVTYNTKPAVGAVLADAAPATANVYNEITLPAPAAGENCYALTKTGNNWMTVSSRESTNPPQLAVTYTPVDTTPPDTTITSGPADGGSTTDTTPTFAFTANEPSTFQCALDDRVLFACTSPYTLSAQSQGAHQFTVQATDTAGNVDPTPVLRTYTVVPAPPPDTSPVAHCDGTPVNVTPSTLSSVLASRDNVVVNAAPGNYGSLFVFPSTPKTCIEIHCTAEAGTGGIENSGGCRATGQWTLGAIRNLTVEDFHFVTSDDYGLALYDEDPYVGAKMRIADNVFHGNMFHDISTKNRVLYTEVLDNLFISCKSHCFEIGQNGNIRTRWSTTGDALFKGNIVSSRAMGVTQRYNLRLTVEGNTFGSVAGYAVETEPYWKLYPFGDSGDNGGLYVPGSEDGTFDPLRTTVQGNSFSSGNRMYFTGRGSADDVVLVKSNTGTTPSCTRGSMDSRTAGTSAAHVNEQTLNPPSLDATSDVPC
jgi:hypothetical protein